MPSNPAPTPPDTATLRKLLAEVPSEFFPTWTVERDKSSRKKWVVLSSGAEFEPLEVGTFSSQTAAEFVAAMFNAAPALLGCTGTLDQGENTFQVPLDGPNKAAGTLAVVLYAFAIGDQDLGRSVLIRAGVSWPGPRDWPGDWESEYQGLTSLHFAASHGVEEAKDMLDWAYENAASVSEMWSYGRALRGEDLSEPVQNERVKQAIALSGPSQELLALAWKYTRNLFGDSDAPSGI